MTRFKVFSSTLRSNSGHFRRMMDLCTAWLWTWLQSWSARRVHVRFYGIRLHWFRIWRRNSWSNSTWAATWSWPSRRSFRNGKKRGGAGWFTSWVGRCSWGVSIWRGCLTAVCGAGVPVCAAVRCRLPKKNAGCLERLELVGATARSKNTMKQRCTSWICSLTFCWEKEVAKCGEPETENFWDWLRKIWSIRIRRRKGPIRSTTSAESSQDHQRSSSMDTWWIRSPIAIMMVWKTWFDTWHSLQLGQSNDLRNQMIKQA